jgi:alpha-1,2-mannosyltransferase
LTAEIRPRQRTYQSPALGERPIRSPSDEGVDFRQFYEASVRLLHGANPYTTPLGNHLGQHHGLVYPPLSALVFVPFTAISAHAASVVFGLICFALVPATLAVLGVRDWRVYTVTLAWAPFVVAWQTGNETALLLLLVAVVWRYRDRTAVAGTLIAVAISLKLLMWPLLIWLLATRRWRAAGWALLAGTLINATCAALVGVNRIGTFLDESNHAVGAAWHAGYSVAATLAPFGVAHSTGSVLTLLASIAVVLMVVHSGYARRQDRHALTLAIVLMLVASPIVHNHYFLLLLVPMAIGRPRLTWLWAAPIVMWICPYGPGSNVWQRPLAWALAAIIVCTLLDVRVRPLVSRSRGASTALPGANGASSAAAGP